MKMITFVLSSFFISSSFAAVKCTDYQRTNKGEFKVTATALSRESRAEASMDAQHEAEVCAIEYCEKADDLNICEIVASGVSFQGMDGDRYKSKAYAIAVP